MSRAVSDHVRREPTGEDAMREAEMKILETQLKILETQIKLEKGLS